MRRRHTALLIFLLLVLLISVPLVLTWRQVRQEQLNHALIAAVDRNDVAVVRKILRAGANPTAQILPEDPRPMWKRIWETLQHHPAPHSLTEGSLLLTAVTWSRAEEPNRIIDNADTVQALVSAGADVNFRGGDPIEPPLTMAVFRKEWQTVKVLLDHNADVNLADGNGITPLMFAAFQVNTELVATLLGKGANMNARDQRSRTPLIWAVQSRCPATEVRQTVAYLLQQGASVNDKDQWGNTALDLATGTPQDRQQHDKKLIQMLKAARAKK